MRTVAEEPNVGKALFVGEAGGHVDPDDVLAVGEGLYELVYPDVLRHDFVDVLVIAPEIAVASLVRNLARQQRVQEDLGGGLLFADLRKENGNSLGYVFRRIGPGVVRADHEGNGLCLDAVQKTAVHDVPEEVLNLVAAEAEVEYAVALEFPVENFVFALVFPEVGYRVAEPYGVVGLVGRSELFGALCGEAVIAGLGEPPVLQLRGKRIRTPLGQGGGRRLCGRGRRLGAYSQRIV